jgi:hypothetical protein
VIPPLVGANTYHYKIYDHYGCTYDTSITITTKGFKFSAVKSDISCNGEEDGSIVLETTKDSLSYLWNTGDTIQNLYGLTSGVYEVTVTDNGICPKTAIYRINEPAPLNITIDNITNTTCGNNNGAIATTTTGGHGQYSYSWSNGDSTKDISGLPANSYTISATDNKGCSASKIIAITNTDGPIITELEHRNEKCNGSSSGYIKVSATGTGTLTYNWENGSTDSIRENLSAGFYSLTVTDSSTNCSAVFATEITEPKPLLAYRKVKSVKCYGDSTGAIFAKAKGGTAPYTYSWIGPNSYASTDSVDLSVAQGSYSLTVTDDSGCTANILAWVDEPEAISITLDPVDVSCYHKDDGSISLTVNGGTPEYHYNWSNGEHSQNISYLRDGNYTVTVTDQNGCAKDTSVIINEPSAITITIDNITNSTSKEILKK